MHWRERKGRRPAINETGHAHEFTFTCFHRFRFLVADRTCQWLAEAIDEARLKLDFALWAYVFMPEHVHLVVYPRRSEYDVSAILKAIKEPVGRQAIAWLKQENPQWLSRITVTHGKREERRFWEAGGGFDRNITEAQALLNMINYIHENPVRAKLVQTPEEWKWSSAGWMQARAINSLRPDPVPPDWGLVECPGKD